MDDSSKGIIGKLPGYSDIKRELRNWLANWWTKGKSRLKAGCSQDWLPHIVKV
jgi:hypothetical protein